MRHAVPGSARTGPWLPPRLLQGSRRDINPVRKTSKCLEQLWAVSPSTSVKGADIWLGTLALSTVPSSSRQAETALHCAPSQFSRQTGLRFRNEGLMRARSMKVAKDQTSGFDLSVAVALAAAAFEAYLEPAGAEGFQDITVNGTETTYTDRAFLRDTFDGLLVLTLHKAEGLKEVNLTGGSDPYVVVSVGDSCGSTNVIWGSTNPVWDQKVNLYVRDASEDIVRIRLYDKNKLMADKELGTAMASVTALKEANQLVLPLRGANAQGTITVSGQYLRFADEAAVVEALVAEDKAPVAEPKGPALELPPEVGAAVAAVAGVHEEAAEQLQKSKESVEQQVQALAPPAGDAGSLQPPQAAVGPEAAAVVVAEQGGSAAADKSFKEVVDSARSKAVAALEGSIAPLETKLAESGLADKAEALHGVKDAAVAQLNSAADTVSQLMESRGLGAVPVSELSRILSNIKLMGAEDKEAAAAAGKAVAQAKAETVAEAAAASEKPGLTPEQMPTAWKALAEVAGKMVEDVFQPVAFLDNPESDTQVWIYRSCQLREVVVAFRGTEQVKWKDFVSDINLVPTALDMERTGTVDLGLGTITLPFAAFKKNKEIMVHTGFLTAYDSVRAKVITLVDELTRGATPEDPWVVFVTGHSLGGALATLCSYELAGRRVSSTGAHKVIMYTYGAPRVGNEAFASAFNSRLGGASWRITNTSDIVPSVPRLMGYAHVKTGVRLTGGGGLLFEDQPKDVLGEGREVLDVLQELASQAMEVAQGARELESLINPFQEHELEILNALVDGSALEQHMEDFYLLTLKDCVLAADPRLKQQVEEVIWTAAAASGAGTVGAAAAGADKARGL